MSASKSYINKEDVLRYLNNKGIDSITRQIKIDMIFNADMLVMDTWSSKFYHNLNPKEREIRKKLGDKYRYSSSFNFIEDVDYQDLTSISEALLSLISDESWIDVHVILQKLRINVNEEEVGSYRILKEKCIEAAINHFN
jgi:hypothetical protein